MINARANGSIDANATTKISIDAQFNLFRTIVITALGLFIGAILGGVVGLFVYANSRNPSAHDGVYALIQTAGVLLGIALGYLTAKGVQAQEQMIDASAKAGVTLLKKYRSRPGSPAQANVGQRNIGQKTIGDDYLRQLLSTIPKTQ
ncbi:MAG: hypothetical protein M3Z37_06060 [Candidatus Eremiobacteraeota bacterium]|nr:hypothetical protein [Candidatus Eremiobacteraeota bacterium]